MFRLNEGHVTIWSQKKHLVEPDVHVPEGPAAQQPPLAPPDEALLLLVQHEALVKEEGSNTGTGGSGAFFSTARLGGSRLPNLGTSLKVREYDWKVSCVYPCPGDASRIVIFRLPGSGPPPPQTGVVNQRPKAEPESISPANGKK